MHLRSNAAEASPGTVGLAAATGVAAILAASPATPQDLAAAEQLAVAAVERTVDAVERSGDGDELYRSAERAAASAERARRAFAAAERAREAAETRYRNAYAAALAGAVTCANGYPCRDGRVEPFDGVSAAYAAHFDLIAEVSAANAAYVDAVGMPGAGAARARAARVRELAARMRRLEIPADAAEWNGLLRDVGTEIDADNLLQGRVSEWRRAAKRALFDTSSLALQALSTAADRFLPRRATGSDGAGAGRTAGAAPTGASVRIDAALRSAVDGARDRMTALREAIVTVDGTDGDDPTTVADDTPRRRDATAERTAADSGTTVTPGVPSRADTETGGPDGDGGTTVADDAPRRRDAAAAAPVPDRRLEDWVRALNAAARAAEQAAEEAEALVTSSGSWFSRVSACIDARARTTAAADRVASLTTGDDRPPYVPAAAGRDAYDQLRARVESATHRAGAACDSIEQPR